MVLLCQLLYDRFDCDKHEVLIRQVFAIMQLTSVADYVSRFTELVDQLASYYSTSTDPFYCTICFNDGLHRHIRSVVLIQIPNDLYTSSTLALF